MIKYNELKVDYNDYTTMYKVNDAVGYFLNKEVDNNNKTKAMRLHAKILNPFLKCMETMGLSSQIIILPSILGDDDFKHKDNWVIEQDHYLIIKIPEDTILDEIKIIEKCF